MQTNKSTKNRIPTSQLMLLAALLCLVVLVATFLIGRSLVGTILLNNKVISRKTVAARQLGENLAAVPQLQSNYQALGGRQQTVLNSLPTKPDFPALAAITETIAGVSGLRVRAITPGTTGNNQASAQSSGSAAKPAGPQSYPFTLTAEGGYPNFLGFLNNLEVSSRPVRFNSAKVSGSSNQVNAEFELTTYYQEATSPKYRTEEVK